MAFNGLATSAGSIIPSLVGSFGGFEELGLASQLRGNVGVADDLRAPMVDHLGLLGAGAGLALMAATLSLLRWKGWRGSWRTNERYGLRGFPGATFSPIFTHQKNNRHLPSNLEV